METNPTEEKPRPPILIRDAEENDIPFIMNSWAESYRNSPIMRRVNPKIFWDGQNSITRKILEHAEVHVAVNPEDMSHIYGFMCVERTRYLHILHYCYVKKSFREMGICNELANSFDLRNQENLASHDTWFFPLLKERYRLMYNPFLLIGGFYGDRSIEIE